MERAATPDRVREAVTGDEPHQPRVRCLFPAVGRLVSHRDIA